MSDGGAVDRPGHLVVGEQPLHRAAGHQPVVEPLVGPHVGVLQVDQVQPRVAPAPARPATGSPPAAAAWPASPAGRRSASGRSRGRRAPPPSGAARPRSARRPRPGAATNFCACSRYTRCTSIAVSRRPSRSRTLCVSDGSWLIACSASTGSSIARSPGQRPRLDHGQHQRRRPDLQVGRDLGEVGVADDHVQPAVLVGVGVRLVAGVDDRPLQRRLQADLDLEEVRPLGQLEALGAALGADADPPGAGEDLPGHEERDQAADDVDERRLPVHQVVLVRAVRGALAVGVVLVELDRLGCPGCGPRGGPPRPSPAPPPCPRGRCRAGWSPRASSTRGARGRRRAGRRWSG